MERYDHLHFSKRWAERGLASVDPVWLLETICARHRQIKADEHQEFLTRVTRMRQKSSNREVGFYRFHVEDQAFYALIDERSSKCITVYDQAMYAARRKQNRKYKRRKRSRVGSKDRRR